eukprot:Gb_38081 [translate_table: standard]
MFEKGNPLTLAGKQNIKLCLNEEKAAGHDQAWIEEQLVKTTAQSGRLPKKEIYMASAMEVTVLTFLQLIPGSPLSSDDHRMNAGRGIMMFECKKTRAESLLPSRISNAPSCLFTQDGMDHVCRVAVLQTCVTLFGSHVAVSRDSPVPSHNWLQRYSRLQYVAGLAGGPLS